MIIMRKFLCVFMTLIACGCSTWTKGSTCHILIEEKGFNQQQLEKIHAAVAEWNKALDGYLKFEYVTQKGDEDLVVIRARTIDPVLQNNKYLGETFSDPWADGGGIELPVNMGSDIDSVYFSRIVLHELGHSLGLYHVDATGAVMNKRPDLEADQVTCIDLTDFCYSAGCDASTFERCNL